MEIEAWKIAETVKAVKEIFGDADVVLMLFDDKGRGHAVFGTDAKSDKDALYFIRKLREAADGMEQAYHNHKAQQN